MEILITNDDGVYAPGILALADALTSVADVIVVAPESEQSGVSHALTFLTPFFLNELESDRPNLKRFSVNGTPADCTKLGLVEVCPRKPDMVISGINGGLNVGINCIYSGTLAGAREAAFFGVPSYAVSMEVARKGVSNPVHVARAAELARDLILKLNDRSADPGIHYNINYPVHALEGTAEIRVVPMETTRFDYRFQQGTDPTGRPYYWTGHSAANVDPERLTDVTTVERGFVTVTPMHYDLTRTDLLDSFAGFLEP